MSNNSNKQVDAGLAIVVQLVAVPLLYLFAYATATFYGWISKETFGILTGVTLIVGHFIIWLVVFMATLLLLLSIVQLRIASGLIILFLSSVIFNFTGTAPVPLFYSMHNPTITEQDKFESQFTETQYRKAARNYFYDRHKDEWNLRPHNKEELKISRHGGHEIRYFCQYQPSYSPGNFQSGKSDTVFKSTLADLMVGGIVSTE